MKKIVIFLCIFLFGTFLFSQSFSKVGDIIELSGLSYEENLIKDFSFENNYLLFRNYDLGLPENKYIIQSYNFTYSTINKLTFLKLDDEDSFLCLANEDLCILYDKNSLEPKYIGSSFTEFFNTLSDKNIEASSELTEGKKIYKASNLCDLKLASPWVESSRGFGIGEYIIFEASASYIYFLNGYVSFDKPYLYTANSRVKKIKLSFLDENNRQPLIVDIKDTPNPQKISFGFRSKGKIKMEILDVYPGDKYQDTCINSIILRIY